MQSWLANSSATPADAPHTPAPRASFSFTGFSNMRGLHLRKQSYEFSRDVHPGFIRALGAGLVYARAVPRPITALKCGQSLNHCFDQFEIVVIARLFPSPGRAPPDLAALRCPVHILAAPAAGVQVPSREFQGDRVAGAPAVVREERRADAVLEIPLFQLR